MYSSSISSILAVDIQHYSPLSSEIVSAEVTVTSVDNDQNWTTVTDTSTALLRFSISDQLSFYPPFIKRHSLHHSRSTKSTLLFARSHT